MTWYLRSVLSQLLYQLFKGWLNCVISMSRIRFRSDPLITAFVNSFPSKLKLTVTECFNALFDFVVFDGGLCTAPLIHSLCSQKSLSAVCIIWSTITGNRKKCDATDLLRRRRCTKFWEMLPFCLHSPCTSLITADCAGRPFVLRFERFNSFREKSTVGVDSMKNHHVHGFSFIIISGVAINQTVRGLIVYDIDVSAMAITRW